MKEDHQQATEEKDNQIQAHQQKIFILNEEIDDLLKNRHVAHRGYFDKVLCFIKKNRKRLTHITLFDVSIDSLKNIRNVLNFVTQT